MNSKEVYSGNHLKNHVCILLNNKNNILQADEINIFQWGLEFYFIIWTKNCVKLSKYANLTLSYNYNLLNLSKL